MMKIALAFAPLAFVACTTSAGDPEAATQESRSDLGTASPAEDNGTPSLDGVPHAGRGAWIPGSSPRFTYVPEMAPLPFPEAEDLKETCPVDGIVVAAWRTLSPRILPRLDRQAIVDASGWAVDEMRRSFVLAPQANAEPHFALCNDRLLLAEVTLQTLPSHHRLVTRWLKAYVLFERAPLSPRQTFVTIRGERLE